MYAIVGTVSTYRGEQFLSYLKYLTLANETLTRSVIISLTLTAIARFFSRPRAAQKLSRLFRVSFFCSRKLRCKRITCHDNKQ